MTASIGGRRTSPVIRVFVSSTFADLQHERNALHERVFPQLEALCAQRGFQFHAIDLRWGIPAEASLDHRTMQICFAELERAQHVSPKPNFLILLGDRYGWRPLPELLNAAEYDKILQAARIEGGTETLYRWYTRDENAIVPTYVLRSRLHDNSDGATNADWALVETTLWRILNRAFPPEQLAGRFKIDREFAASIVRCQASATEQEIWRGALLVADASEHVVAWFRNIENLREMEGTSGLATFTDLIGERGTFDQIARQALDDLKAAIRRQLGRGLILSGTARLFRHDRKGSLSVDITKGHIDLMCEEIGSRLATIARQQMEEYWQGSEPTGTQARRMRIEIEAHNRFAEQRAADRKFIGRERELGIINDYLGGPSREPLVVIGPAGSGKTALMARAALGVEPGRSTIARFIGISPGSSELLPLLHGICSDLRQRDGSDENPPLEVKALVREFARFLGKTDRPMAIFLDGLDALGDSDSGRELSWIPEIALANGAKLVLSCLSDRDPSEPAGEAMAALARRTLSAANFLLLGELDLEHAKALFFDRWLAGDGRRLTGFQAQIVDALLDEDDCRQPLFLKLLFEEARLWRSNMVPTTPGKRVTDLLDSLFDRLCLRTNHGATAAAILGYLSVARRGLSDAEMLEILFQDPDYRAFLERSRSRTGQALPAGASRVPVAPCARVWHDLAPYLASRQAPGGTVMVFYHRVIAEHARARFAPPEVEGSWHRKLADWLCGEKDFIDSNFEQRVGNARKADELPWQLARAGMWDELETLHCRIGFLESAFLSNLVDNVAVGAAEAARQAKVPTTAAIGQAILRTGAAFRDRPDLALQTLRNDLAFVPHSAAESLVRTIEEELDRRGHWLRAETGPIQTGLDKTANWSPHQASATQALSASRRELFVATEEGSVEEYLLESGRSLGVRYLGAGKIEWLAVSRSGRLAWRTHDGSVQVAGGAHAIRGRRIADEGDFLGEHRLLLATEDRLLVTWDIRTGKTSTVVENLAPRPIIVAVSGDGQHAVVLAWLTGGSQFIALVRNTEQGVKVWRMNFPAVPAMACDLSGNGQLIVLAMLDRTLRLYDSGWHEMGRIRYEVDSNNGVTGMASACAFARGNTPDKVLLATNSGKLGLWGLVAGDFSEIGTYASVDQRTPLLTLCLVDDDRFAAGTASEIRIAPLIARPMGLPPTSISACATGGDGWIAVASDVGEYVAWHRGSPLVAAGFCAAPHPTALAFAGSDGMLFVGNRQGEVWRQRPGEPRREQDVLLLFDQPVVSLFVTPDGRVVAAAESGAVTLVDFDTPEVRPLVPGNPLTVLMKIIRCNDRGDFLYWSHSKGTGPAETIGIVGPGEHLETISRPAGHAAAVAVAPSGKCIAIATQNGVDLLRQRNDRWILTLHSDRRGSHIGFVGSGYLAVVPFDRGQWLEIWSVTDGLKSIATAWIPADCRVISTDTKRVLIGAADGSLALWSLRSREGLL